MTVKEMKALKAGQRIRRRAVNSDDKKGREGVVVGKGIHLLPPKRAALVILWDGMRTIATWTFTKTDAASLSVI